VDILSHSMWQIYTFLLKDPYKMQHF